MKKKISLILCAVLSLTALGACQQKEDPSVKQTRAGWLLSVPAYMGGTLSYKSYNIGTGVDMDTASSAGDLQLAYNTTRDEFNTYLYKVKKNGYDEIAKTEVNGNAFVQFAKDNKILYTYYLDYLKETRVVEDSASALESAVEYEYTVKDNEQTIIYQYALMNDPYAKNDGSTPYQDNGMFYIIRQANGKVILIDGGSKVQATARAVDELFAFLYEITGKNESEKIEVSALIISHAHEDHKEFAHKLIEKYFDKITVERAIYNLPFWSNTQSEGSDFAKFGALLKTKYPAMQYIKAHTGQSIKLGEVTLDIMLTHEDLLESKVAMTKARNFNDTTTVFKYTVNGKTFLQLGDYGGSSDIARQFLGMYKQGNTYPALKSDIVQTAHHAMNDWLEDLYLAVRANYAFVPTADCKFSDYQDIVNPCYNNTVSQIIDANDSVKLYFQNRKTYALAIAKNGAITEVTPTDIRGANDGYDTLLSAVTPFSR